MMEIQFDLRFVASVLSFSAIDPWTVFRETPESPPNTKVKKDMVAAEGFDTGSL